MKVLCIISHEDSNSGEVTAVLEVTEGVDSDDVFIEWLRKNSLHYAKLSREKCLESEYAWNVYDVK